MPLRLLVDVDVERPVREDERLGERLLRRAFGEARQESGDRESGAAGERAAQECLAGERVGHGADSSVGSRTNVDSGSQWTVRASPGSAPVVPASTFWA